MFPCSHLLFVFHKKQTNIKETKRMLCFVEKNTDRLCFVKPKYTVLCKFIRKKSIYRYISLSRTMN